MTGDRISPHLLAQAKYYSLRERYDVAHRASIEAYKAMKEAEDELVEAMLAEGVPSFSLADGSSIHLRNATSISVTQENDDVVRQFLYDTVGDDTPFVREALDKAAIMEMISARLEKGELSQDQVPAEMKLRLRPAITVRGWNARQQQ